MRDFLKPSLIFVSFALLASCFQNAKVNSSKDAELAMSARNIADGTEAQFSADSARGFQLSMKSDRKDLDPLANRLSAERFSRADIGMHQVAGSDLTNTPRELQGIWWMDGNPLGDETVSFARVDFNLDHPLLSVFAPNNFAFVAGNEQDPVTSQESKDEAFGKVAFDWVNGIGLVYELTFPQKGDDKYHKATIVPSVVMRVGLLEKRVRISSKIVGASMTRVNENLYERETSALGKTIPSYQLRRILVPSAADPKVLEKTEYWDAYEKTSFPVQLKMSVRK